jgi:hypothetical protein
MLVSIEIHTEVIMEAVAPPQSLLKRLWLSHLLLRNLQHHQAHLDATVHNIQANTAAIACILKKINLVLDRVRDRDHDRASKVITDAQSLERERDLDRDRDHTNIIVACIG